MNRRAGKIFFCAALSFLSACAVNQKAEVSQYRTILDKNEEPAPPPRDDKPLTLQQAMSLANQYDETLASRGEDYVQSLIDRNRALANFLPTVSFQPSFVVAQPSTGTLAPAGTTPQAALGPTSTGFVETSASPVAQSLSPDPIVSPGTGAFRRSGPFVTRLEAPVVGSINLFHGFGDLANADVASWNIDRQRELLLDLQATILLNVAQGYYQVLRSEAQVGVLKNSLLVQDTRVHLIHDQFFEKLATRLDVAQTEAQAEATKVSLIQAETDVQNARATLAFLIGQKEVKSPLVDDFAPPTPKPESDYMTDALKTRRDLLAAQFNINSARRAVDVYIAEYYPSVSLNVAGFLYREYFSEASKWDAVLSANLPIFSAGLIEADVRAAWSRLRQAALAELNTRRSVMHDVQIAYANLISSQRQIKELEGEVAAAAEAYRQAQNAFQNGLAINLDVLSAQDQLLNAELELTGVRYDRIVFYLDLRRVSGHLNSDEPANPRSVSPSPATQPQ